MILKKVYPLVEQEDFSVRSLNNINQQQEGNKFMKIISFFLDYLESH